MYNIANRLRFTIICVLFFSTANVVSAQDTTLNRYRLWVINTVIELQKTIKKDHEKLMVDLKKTVPSIVFDLRYASENNFMHTKLYPSLHTTFLRRPAATALIKIQAALNKQGLGLKIFDAYRPYSVTEKMWEPVQDDRYAADPKKGSGHNRGIAVDLTLIDLKTKKELDMGTGFDNFTDSAHHDFTMLPANVLEHRKLLKSIMEKNGFKALDTEWWHYSLPNAKDFELLDVSFTELELLQNMQVKIKN